MSVFTFVLRFVIQFYLLRCIDGHLRVTCVHVESDFLPTHEEVFQMDPELLFWRSVFVGCLGYRGQTKTHGFRNDWFVGLAAFASKTLFSQKGVVVWPRCPRPPRKHLAKNNFGIPLS